MLGALDLATGRINRVVSGTGAQLKLDPLHPFSATPLVSVTLTGWERIREVALAAAPIFAGIHLQSWDVAVTDSGPALLEVNFGGDLNLGQLAAGKGALDTEYAAHLQEWGYRIDQQV